MRARRTFIGMALLLLAAAGAVAQAKRVTLDDALKVAAEQFSGTLKKGTTVAILGISSGSERLDEYVLDEFTTDMVQLRQVQIVTRANLDVIKKEMNFQLSGEVSDETMQQLGAKTGAQTVISGTLKDLGAGYILNIQAFDVTTAAIQDVYRTQLEEDDTLGLLLNKRSVKEVKKSQKEARLAENSEMPGWQHNIGAGLALGVGNVDVNGNGSSGGSSSMEQTDVCFGVQYLGVASGGFALKAAVAFGGVTQNMEGEGADSGSTIALTAGVGYAFVHKQKALVALTAMLEYDATDTTYSFDEYDGSYSFDISMGNFGFGADLTAVYRFSAHVGIYGALGLRYEFGSISLSDSDGDLSGDTTRFLVAPSVGLMFTF